MPYKNIEDRKKNAKEYYNSSHGRKRHRIKCWKRSGIKLDNYDLFYDYFLLQDKCWICDVVFDENKNNRRCLDHDHETGEVRYIVCSFCNLNIIK